MSILCRSCIRKSLSEDRGCIVFGIVLGFWLGNEAAWRYPSYDVHRSDFSTVLVRTRLRLPHIEITCPSILSNQRGFGTEFLK